MHKKAIYFIFYLLIFVGSTRNVLAQNIPIGTWQDHLPYRQATSITEGNEKIYCATNSALFTYDLTDNSLETISLINGLSDIGISQIKFVEKNKRLVIAYTNGNIDVIDENKTITNLAFIKNSNIIGDKSINHILVKNHLAYLSTSFGIVVLDTDKLEIKNTYLIGNLGAFVKVNSIAIDTSNIYAATDEGLYYADKNSATLVDYNQWAKVPQLKDSVYSNVLFFKNQLFLIQERGAAPDSIFYGVNGIWQPFLQPAGYTNKLCQLNEETIAILWNWGVSFYDKDLNKYAEIYNYAPNEIIRAKNFDYWMADNEKGLVKFNDLWTNDIETFVPEGPFSVDIFDIDLVENSMWYVTGGYSPSSLEPIFFRNHLVNYKKNDKWYSLGKIINNAKGETTFDAVRVAINPSNTEQVYIGTWNDGLFEVNNDVITNIYTAKNTSLDSTFFGTTKIGGLAFDKNNNLWICSTSNKQIDVKTSDNSWYNFTLSNINNSGAFTSLIIDKNGFKWIGSQNEKEIVVFDDNNTFSNSSDDRTVLIKNFPGAKTFAITEDKDGEIWIGTDEGIAVFYNPSQVFDEDLEAEQIYIQQDGQTQILLENKTVNAITIDGANRKWIATQSSGVFLMSADGTEEIVHFTTDNSPLFSNTVFDIAINNETGEVFFATDKGLISYKGTATEPLDDFNIFVYPNPVKPDYEGVVAIRGLVKDTDVRITDISGNTVFETTSIGGQAVWNGKDFHGNRVQSGVYMVFNGSQDGNLKAAAKILFLN